MVESTTETNNKPVDGQSDSIEEERKNSPRQQKEKTPKEKELTEEELEEIAKGKQIFKGDP